MQNALWFFSVRLAVLSECIHCIYMKESIEHTYYTMEQYNHCGVEYR